MLTFTRISCGAARVIDVKVTGVAGVDRALDEVSGSSLARRIRSGEMAGATSFAAAIAAEARRRAAAGPSHVPADFARTATRRTARGVIIRPASPLLAIFEEGAGPHAIAPRHGRRLGGRGGRGMGAGQRDRASAFFVSGPVQHPGMAARPILGPAFTVGETPAVRSVSEALFGNAPRRGGPL